MKVVLISDTHNHRMKEEDLPDGDILIHAGDATGEGTIQEVLKFYKWFGAIKKFKYKIFVPGNHDWLFDKNWGLAMSVTPSDVIVLHNSGKEIEGKLFWGSGVTPYFFGWAFNVRGHLIERYWEMIPEQTDVLITHGPPFMIGDRTWGGEHVGDRYLNKHIARLDNLSLHVCGHIHWSNGLVKQGNVTYVNASLCDEDYKLTQKPHVVEL